MSLRVPLIGGLVAVILAAVFFFFLYRPQVQEQALLRDETAQLQAEQTSLQQQITELEQIRDDEQSYLTRLDRLEELVPSDVAQPAAIRQLQAAADASGLEIQSVTFSDPVPTTPEVPVGATEQLGEIGLTMVLEGGYFQQVDFLRRLEQDTTRAVLIESVAVGEAEDSFPTLSTTVTGSIFALIPATPDPAVTDAPDSEAADSETSQ